MQIIQVNLRALSLGEIGTMCALAERKGGGDISTPAGFSIKGGHNFMRSFIGNSFSNITLLYTIVGTIQSSHDLIEYSIIVVNRFVSNPPEF